jgi:tRNA A37 threonylcarbamoyltransferase TsaD
MAKSFSDLSIRIPEKELTTDNAVMIAMAGYLSHISGLDSEVELKAKGNLKYV